MKKSYSLLNEVTLILVLLKFDMDAVLIEIEIWVMKIILSISRAFLIADELGISFTIRTNSGISFDNINFAEAR